MLLDGRHPPRRSFEARVALALTLGLLTVSRAAASPIEDLGDFVVTRGAAFPVIGDFLLATDLSGDEIYVPSLFENGVVGPNGIFQPGEAVPLSAYIFGGGDVDSLGSSVSIRGTTFEAIGLGGSFRLVSKSVAAPPLAVGETAILEERFRLESSLRMYDPSVARTTHRFDLSGSGWVTVHLGRCCPGGGPTYWEARDIRYAFGAVAVPEPATILLLIFGLSVLGFRRLASASATPPARTRTPRTYGP